MLRSWACLLFLPGFVLAAPLPDKKAATEKYLEQLWAEMDKDYVTALPAAYRLHHHAGKVEFLARKLPPIRADKDDTIMHLNALDSEDEKVWKPAMEQLRYHHPALAIPYKEQLDSVATPAGQKRWLLAIRSPWTDFSNQDLTEPLTYREARGPNGLQRYVEHKAKQNFGSHSCQLQLPQEMGESQDTPSWLGLSLLHFAEVDSATRALAKFAQGDERMKLTQFAIRQSKLKKPDWNMKHDRASIKKILPEYDLFKILQLMIELEQHPKLEEIIADLVFPIAITLEDQEKLLNQLVSEDEKTWTVAYEMLLKFHVYLNFTAEDLCQREWPEGTLNRLYGVLGWYSRESIKASQFTSVSVDDSKLGKSIRFRQKNGSAGFEVCPLKQLRSESWRSIRLLLPVLAQRDTPASRKLIEQVAKGHPDILPTREAKALLK